MLNGSPRANGNTARALSELENIFAAEGIETETVQIGNKEIRGCTSCFSCYKTGKCVIDDIVNESLPLLQNTVRKKTESFATFVTTSLIWSRLLYLAAAVILQDPITG